VKDIVGVEVGSTRQAALRRIGVEAESPKRRDNHGRERDDVTVFRLQSPSALLAASYVDLEYPR
jgi:hypothetical protein